MTGSVSAVPSERMTGSVSAAPSDTDRADDQCVLRVLVI